MQFNASYIAPLFAMCMAVFSISRVGAADAQPNTTDAHAIWHCSRNEATQQAATELNLQDEFKLSSMDTIGVTLDDLMRVYSGQDIWIGNLPLIACFMPGQETLSQNIFKSLGLKGYILKKLSVKSAIVQGQLVTVSDEEQMQLCMGKHFPSFGYLSHETVTEKFAPCF